MPRKTLGQRPACDQRVGCIMKWGSMLLVTQGTFASYGSLAPPHPHPEDCWVFVGFID